MRDLLEAGLHFGHETKWWNPRMRPYIYGARSGIHILDLNQTLPMFRDALHFISRLGAEGKTILFVGTKRQAQEVIASEASRVDAFYVNHRWLGGLLTNFKTIRKSIARFQELRDITDNADLGGFSNKARSRLDKRRRRLEKTLAGIEKMERLPDAICIVDPKNEMIAVHEARKLGIPIIAIVDSDCDPDLIDYIIPGNDDALRAIRLFASRVASAFEEGRRLHGSAETEDFAEPVAETPEAQTPDAPEENGAEASQETSPAPEDSVESAAGTAPAATAEEAETPPPEPESPADSSDPSSA